MNDLNNNWVEVCDESEIEIDDLKRFDYENKTFCVYRIKDGFYTTDGLCFYGLAPCSRHMVKFKVVRRFNYDFFIIK